MGKILSSYIFPHPPIVIPEIGKGEELKALNTVEGCKNASNLIAQKNPGTIIIITPHGPAFRDALCVSVKNTLEGSFANFGKPEIKFSFENNIRLVNQILINSQKQDLSIVPLNQEIILKFGIDVSLDHGALVPLYYISKSAADFKIVHISMGFLNYNELFRIGLCINEVVKESNDDVVIIASGDLSHKLIPGAPCGYDKRGKQFDEKLVGLLGKGDFESVMSLDEELIDAAGECGLRPIITMLGCIKDYKVRPSIISYEGPFGVGYCVAEFDLKEEA